MKLELDQHEHQVLTQLVASAVGTLREEIYKTDSTEYEAALRERETVLLQIQERLSSLASTSVSA